MVNSDSLCDIINMVNKYTERCTHGLCFLSVFLIKIIFNEELLDPCIFHGIRFSFSFLHENLVLIIKTTIQETRKEINAYNTAILFDSTDLVVFQVAGNSTKCMYTAM